MAVTAMVVITRLQMIGMQCSYHYISNFTHMLTPLYPSRVVNPWYPSYPHSNPYPCVPQGQGVGFLRGKGGGIVPGTLGFTPAIP
jgi:hypothetical protein